MGVRHEIDVQSLWAEYEKIAMHFNDLLMRLRTQSLAGIAAVATLVGIFAKEGGNLHLDWVIAKAIFIALIGFWVAIWCLDMLYYNVLLRGAVTAIQKLEKQTEPGAPPFDGQIDMSTLIEAAFDGPMWGLKRRFVGVVLFYSIVGAVIVAGFFFTRHMAHVT